MKKILVLVRETFPTDETFNLKNIKEKRVLNPYDEYALFQSKKIKKIANAEITCLFISQRENQYGLRTALGLGADKGIFIYYPRDNEKEIADIIAQEIKKIDYDMIFIGIKDVNNDREELPYRLGVNLKLPIYSHILSIDYKNNSFLAQKEKENTIDWIKLYSKGIVAFSQNIYEPQYPSIADILTIKDKPITTINFLPKSNAQELNIIYQDIHRKQNIYKNITSQEATQKIIEYMRKWKLID